VHVPEHHIHVDGLGYYLYKNGSVLDSDLNVICTTGGLDCLIVENEYEPLVYELSDGSVVKLRLFQNGYVDTDDGEYTGICATEGKPCADAYVSNNYPEKVVLKGDNYWLYLDGHSTDAQGNLICADGGRPCLEDWVADNVPTEVTYTVDGTELDFLVYDNGKVIDSNGEVICTTGGQACLEEYILEISAQHYQVLSGEMVYDFLVYGNGQVIGQRDNNVICTTGGVDCLTAWITDNVPEHYLHIDGQYYYIYKNGTVLDAEFNLLCETGGKDCLIEIQEYEELVYELYDGAEVVKLRLF